MFVRRVWVLLIRSRYLNPCLASKYRPKLWETSGLVTGQMRSYSHIKTGSCSSRLQPSSDKVWNQSDTESFSMVLPLGHDVLIRAQGQSGLTLAGGWTALCVFWNTTWFSVVAADKILSVFCLFSSMMAAARYAMLFSPFPSSVQRAWCELYRRTRIL